MKKKLVIFVSLIICSLALLLALSACDSPSNDGSDLQFDKKYIAKEHANKDTEGYYLFHSDGTGIYKYYDEEYDYTVDYTVSFKYTYADNDKTAVVCLFDSVKYGSKHSASSLFNVGTHWTSLLTVSKNVICTTGGNVYINEDYLKEIPNFNS